MDGTADAQEVEPHPGSLSPGPSPEGEGGGHAGEDSAADGHKAVTPHLMRGLKKMAHR